MIWPVLADGAILSKWLPFSKSHDPTFKTNLPNLLHSTSDHYDSILYTSGLYYKLFMIVIYDHNAIGQYYKTTIVDYDRS
jgi:hypothetical protein